MRNEEIEENLIVNLTFEFARNILQHCETLYEKKKFILSNQLLKSGTSIGANVWEAQNAESKPDFIHKFKIGAKEAEETKFWLLLCQDYKDCPDSSKLLEQLNSIQRIITKIIASSKKPKEPASDSSNDE